MKAVIVCVDYSDYLSSTLPYNRHHFEEIVVVTKPTDAETIAVAERNRATIHLTDCFHADGASFNKYRAIEEGLDIIGRDGWTCLLDADIIWPKLTFPYEPGCLYVPLRRMMPDWSGTIPEESAWPLWPIHDLRNHWSGYSQIFHASDLGPGPWHPLDLPNCGTGDTIFQNKWPRELRRRPNFEVLHIGPNRVNWSGRPERLRTVLEQDG